MISFNGFTDKATKAINAAIAAAMSYGHSYVGSEHLLYGLVSDDTTPSAICLKKHGIGRNEVLSRIESLVGKSTPTRLGAADLTPRSKRLMDNAVSLARAENCRAAGTEHLLKAVLIDKECYANVILTELGANTEKLSAETGVRRYVEPSFESTDKERRAKLPTLTKYSKELTDLARKGQLDPVIGRDNETERLIQILLRRYKNNPCLVGEAGVGKTAVVEGFAQRIAACDVPQELLHKRIYSLDITAMLAGAKYRGDFEERIKSAIEEAAGDPDIILFIDELHGIVGTGAAEGAVDAANILKPQLARGEISVIGATTTDEYHKFIEKDSALERRFQPISVDAPSQEEAVEILKGLRRKYELHHHVTITDEAITAAVKISARYIPDRNLPDKAIDLLDETAARVRLHSSNANRTATLESIRRDMAEAAAKKHFTRMPQLRKAESELMAQLCSSAQVHVTAEDITNTAAIVTGIPVSRIAQDERLRLCNIEQLLKSRVIGQDKAIEQVARAVRRGRAGLKEPHRPSCSFMFLGQTGVGKTELCKALAECVYGDESKMIRFDMSEFMEKHSVSKLIGSPPGYVGYGEEGQLIKQVRRRPYSVVLFDEVEKAHPDVLNLLLQILEDGRLTGSDGKTADFCNTIVIMTGNIGADQLTAAHVGFGNTDTVKPDIMRSLKKQFRPEFINRIDSVIVFEQLGEPEIQQICIIMLDSLAKRAAARGIEIHFSDTAIQSLCNEQRDHTMGARPLRRIITSEIEDMLSQKIIDGELSDGCRAEICFADTGYDVRLLSRSQQ